MAHAQPSRQAEDSMATEPMQLNRNSESLYKQIVDIWKTEILTGKLKPGDMLPSERELASALNVSRIPVREALKVLEYLGIVEHVRGKGVFVRQPEPTDILNAVGPLLMATPNMLADLFEVRLLFEPHAAYLAATLSTPEDLARIEETLRHTEASVEYGLTVHSDSYDFHNAVMAASHNDVMLMLSSFLVELQRQSRESTLRGGERNREALEHHKEIYGKIKARDSYGAADTMRKHLLNARNQLFKTITGE